MLRKVGEFLNGRATAAKCERQMNLGVSAVTVGVSSAGLDI
jgi:hypothetical protein